MITASRRPIVALCVFAFALFAVASSSMAAERAQPQSQGVTDGVTMRYCTPGLVKERIIAIHDDNYILCISSFGWSDTFFIAPFPAFYLQSADLFSGEMALNFRYFIDGVLASGLGWLTPGLDWGTLAPFFLTGSSWVVFEEVSYIPGLGTAWAQSIIYHPEHGIVITIVTGLFDGYIFQYFQITNYGPYTLELAGAAIYFNLHPHGSLAGNHERGTIYSLGGAGLLVTGIPGMSSYVADGYAFLGDGNPDDFGIGYARDVIMDVQQGRYVRGDTWSGDGGGALYRNYNTIMSGESREFSVLVGAYRAEARVR